MVKKKVNKLKSEFSKHIITAITAAFAFVIALVWRDAIQSVVNNLLESLSITGEGVGIKVGAAIIVTIICVIGIIVAARFSKN